MNDLVEIIVGATGSINCRIGLYLAYCIGQVITSFENKDLVCVAIKVTQKILLLLLNRKLFL